MASLNRPTFSIVSITFRDLPGLKKTINSVLYQTFEDYEWIVIDGNSGVEVCSFLSGISDHRLKWVSESDSGIFDAMNKGLSMATGEYVVFLNGGDVFASPDTLESVAKFKSDDADLIYGDCVLVFENGDEHHKPARSHKTIWYGMFANHQAMFFRRIQTIGLRFREELKVAGDYCFTAEFLKRCKLVQNAPFIVTRFDMTGVSNTSQHQGRIENWVVQRDVLLMSFPARLVVRLAYLASAVGRQHFKRLYSKWMYQ